MLNFVIGLRELMHSYLVTISMVSYKNMETFRNWTLFEGYLNVHYIEIALHHMKWYEMELSRPIRSFVNDIRE